MTTQENTVVKVSGGRGRKLFTSSVSVGSIVKCLNLPDDEPVSNDVEMYATFASSIADKSDTMMVNQFDKLLSVNIGLKFLNHQILGINRHEIETWGSQEVNYVKSLTIDEKIERLAIFLFDNSTSARSGLQSMDQSVIETAYANWAKLSKSKENKSNIFRLHKIRVYTENELGHTDSMIIYRVESDGLSPDAIMRDALSFLANEGKYMFTADDHMIGASEPMANADNDDNDENGELTL